jgi:hypothetical protein
MPMRLFACSTLLFISLLLLGAKPSTGSPPLTACRDLALELGIASNVCDNGNLSKRISTPRRRGASQICAE